MGGGTGQTGYPGWKWTRDRYGNAILRAVRNFLKVGAQ